METRKFPELELTRVQKIFLKGYAPEDTMFTSGEEIELISKVLGLNDADDETLSAMRNSVVHFYSDIEKELYKLTNSWNDFAYGYIESRNSVTAVIDHVRFSKGMEV